MTLDPPSYRCDTHGLDLTHLVRERLEEYSPGSFRPEFRVPVTCPGPEPHALVFRGRRR